MAGLGWILTIIVGGIAGFIAEKIMNAWLRTLEDGIHTADIYTEGNSIRKVSTSQFAEAVISHLGKTPNILPQVNYTSNPKAGKQKTQFNIISPKVEKKLVGVDVFIDWDENDRDPKVIGDKLADLKIDSLKLKMITNRGVKVYPEGMPETFCTDHWRCRFVATNETVTHDQVLDLLNLINADGFDFIKTEHLYTFNGERGYSLGQGE